MSTSIYGYTDSVSTPVTVNIPSIDWDHDYALKSATPDEVVYSNITTPVDQPYTCKFGVRDIANVYKNKDIDPERMNINKRGKSFLISDILTARIPNAALQRDVDCPVQINTTVTWSNSVGMTPELVQEALKQHAAKSLYYSDPSQLKRINELMHGVLFAKNAE